MKSILTTAILVFLFSYNSLGQSCNCNQEFNYIKDKIEKNYAGFKDKVNAKTETAYYRHTQSALEQSKLVTSPAHCVYLISDWLSFFKDGHLQIGRGRISKEKEEADLKTRIKEIEQINLSNEELKTLKNTKGITGIYWSEDSTSRIAVIRNKTNFRDYAGIVISSKSGIWLPGQVVLELKGGKGTLNE